MPDNQAVEELAVDVSAVEAGLKLEPGHKTIVIISNGSAPEPAPPPPEPAKPPPHEEPPRPAPKLPPPFDKWEKLIAEAARKHDVPPDFICAVIDRESGGKNVIGDHGHAYGLMQIDDRFHDAWLKAHGRGMDPKSNLDFGTSILRANLDVAHKQHKLSGDEALKFAAAAFNSGVHGAAQGLKKGDCDLFTTHRDFGRDVLSRRAKFAHGFDGPQPVTPGGKTPHPSGPAQHPGHHPGHGHPGHKAPPPADPPKDGNENERAYEIGRHVLGQWIHDLKKQAPWSHYLDDVPDSVCCANFVSACFQQAGLITRAQHSDNVDELAKILERSPQWQVVSLDHAQRGDFVRMRTGANGTDRHAVMYSHAEGGLHFFLGSNNVSARPGHPQQISIHEMGYTVLSVHHYRGHRPHVPAQGPKQHEMPAHHPHVDHLPQPYAKWAPLVEEAAKKHDLPPAFICAVISRETGGVNEIGDYGHGHGLMQIDDRSHEAWLKQHQNGMDPKSNIDYGSSLLRAGLDGGIRNFKLRGEAALKFAASAYNAGLTGAERGFRAGDSDRFTTHHNYGSDVVGRMHGFEKGFGKHPVRPGDTPANHHGLPGHHPGHGHHGHPHPKQPPPSGNDNERAYELGHKELGKLIETLKHQPPWSHYLETWVPDGECCSNFVSACFQQTGLITHAMHRDNVNDLASVLESSPHWQTVSLQHAQRGDFVRLITGGGENDRHAVLFSHAENGRHFFLGSNNISGSMQRISIQEMGYAVQSVHHHKGLRPPKPEHKPPAAGHAVVNVALHDADNSELKLTHASVEITVAGKSHAASTDANGALVLHVDAAKGGTFDLVVRSEGTEAHAKKPPPHQVPNDPHGSGSTNPADARQITPAMLKQIMPDAHLSDLRTYAPPLNKAMREFHIHTPRRQAAFLAQLAEESGQFVYKEEIASGRAYEGRIDLGNTHPGDGPRFKGRGLIQVTGRANYAQVGHALGVDLVDHPLRLLEPVLSCRASAYYWFAHGLNQLADEGAFMAITEKINGGTFGLADRERYWANAKRVLGNKA